MPGKNPNPVLIFLILMFSLLAGCDAGQPTPTVTSSAVPASAVPSLTPISKSISCWENWEATKAKDAFECALNKYLEDTEKNPSIAESHFRLGALYWENGYKILGREEIIKAIRLDILNESYLEYLYFQVIPVPEKIKVGDQILLYDDQFRVPYFAVHGDNVARFDVNESYVPANVAVGASSVQLEWQKNSGTWASLVFGFDPEIENRQKALEGGFISLGEIDQFNLDEYALAFRLKGKGVQGSPGVYPELKDTLSIKFQDQNLAIQESIGNQVFYEVTITDSWEEYSIPLSKFYFDEQWITDAVCPLELDFMTCKESSLFYFDWSRVKQINFDVPFYSTSGIIFLDEIKIIHLD